MTMKISISAIVCAVLATAFADQVAAASLSGGYSIGALGIGCSAEGQQGSGSLTESSSGCSDYLASGSFLVSGSGVASYDTLRAAAGAGFSADPKYSHSYGATLASAGGGAGYDDWITIDSPGRTGETVDLDFTTALHGSMTASSSDSSMFGQASASLQVYVNDGYVLVSQGAKSNGDSVFNDFNPGHTQIVLGTPFSVSANLQVEAIVQSTTTNGIYSGDVLAAFANSAGITSFELFETASETPITNWDLASESGEFGFYTVVPVPASGWLFVSGLFGLIGKARGKKAT
jgi:hypothetical protein